MVLVQSASTLALAFFYAYACLAAGEAGSHAAIAAFQAKASGSKPAVARISPKSAEAFAGSLQSLSCDFNFSSDLKTACLRVDKGRVKLFLIISEARDAAK
mgnify:CR=1 FL=1